MAPYGFPRDLRDAQLRLHQAYAAYATLCRELPWSVEPAPGWAGEKQLHSDRIGAMPESPGYTEEQKAAEARLRGLLLELSITVSTHPYWSAVEPSGVVEERRALKHTPGAVTGPGEDELTAPDPATPFDAAA